MRRGYTVFDTALGRCGIAWSDAGVVGVQLPEAREIETLRHLFRQFPEARELRPPPSIEAAIDGIAAALRGHDVDLTEIDLDMSDVAPFNQRVYDYVRQIPRGETRIYDQIAAHLHVGGALHSVANALAKNPFPLIVPCHRVQGAGNGLDKASPHRGIISGRRLLALEGALPEAGLTLFDALLVVDRARAAH
ncbi:methylated-DNA--[protein]-cysteine S-methyltransferase [Bradyrhizobium sp. STM 3557]|uniref:methylated-DNA--[protein]-cysteine S-methyltransferase n=1 Tax=Bradyrhizobium sp. STM 3557 TaxID=578920 RepID=UPI0038905B4F